MEQTDEKQRIKNNNYLQPRLRYNKWFKKDLIEKVRDQELLILELRKDIKLEKNQEKWKDKMKIEELKKSNTEVRVMSVRLPQAIVEFIEKYDIDLKKLIVVAVEELKKQV